MFPAVIHLFFHCVLLSNAHISATETLLVASGGCFWVLPGPHPTPLAPQCLMEASGITLQFIEAASTNRKFYYVFYFGVHLSFILTYLPAGVVKHLE